MIVLDTDHVSVLQHEDSEQALQLEGRIKACRDDVVVTAATIEEQSRSWLSLIGRYSDVRQQVAYYDRLVGLVRFFAAWQILPFDDRAAEEFLRLRHDRIRIATTDLKIASIVLIHDGILITGNSRDFVQVPGLRVENWLGR
jgi:tRNA(fMet)-specific endonuclease VapC